MLLLDLFALTTSLDILFTFDFCKIEASNLQTKEVYYRTWWFNNPRSFIQNMVLLHTKNVCTDHGDHNYAKRCELVIINESQTWILFSVNKIILYHIFWGNFFLKKQHHFCSLIYFWIKIISLSIILYVYYNCYLCKKLADWFVYMHLQISHNDQH